VKVVGLGEVMHGVGADAVGELAVGRELATERFGGDALVMSGLESFELAESALGDRAELEGLAEGGAEGGRVDRGLAGGVLGGNVRTHRIWEPRRSQEGVQRRLGTAVAEGLLKPLVQLGVFFLQPRSDPAVVPSCHRSAGTRFPRGLPKGFRSFRRICNRASSTLEATKHPSARCCGSQSAREAGTARAAFRTPHEHVGAIGHRIPEERLCRAPSLCGLKRRSVAAKA
jgi:hypothetical protein